MRNKGYKVSVMEDKNGQSVELTAHKDRETFFIEGIWETNRPIKQSIQYALSKAAKKMEIHGPWIDHGIAMPKGFFKELKEFETAYFESLKLHLFLVESFYALTHLDAKLTVQLIEHLKANNVSTMNLWGINYE
ncbi:MAG: hypothetical protein ACQCN4_03585 [Candidatus Bathyarchaeia archaeon]|jgi:hypothetical protein